MYFKTCALIDMHKCIQEIYSTHTIECAYRPYRTACRKTCPFETDMLHSFRALVAIYPRVSSKMLNTVAVPTTTYVDSMSLNPI